MCHNVVCCHKVRDILGVFPDNHLWSATKPCSQCLSTCHVCVLFWLWRTPLFCQRAAHFLRTHSYLMAYGLCGPSFCRPLELKHGWLCGCLRPVFLFWQWQRQNLNSISVFWLDVCMETMHASVSKRVHTCTRVWFVITNMSFACLFLINVTQKTVNVVSVTNNRT